MNNFTQDNKVRIIELLEELTLILKQELLSDDTSITDDLSYKHNYRILQSITNHNETKSFEVATIVQVENKIKAIQVFMNRFFSDRVWDNELENDTFNIDDKVFKIEEDRNTYNE